MVHRTVLKVDISCTKCKRQLLKAVSRLQGIDKIEIDDAKSTLTVTGNADPFEVIVRTRKTGNLVEVISIGPPQAPPKPVEVDEKKKAEEKKPEQKKAQEPTPMQVPIPLMCPICEQMAFKSRQQDPQVVCSIL